MQELYQYNIRLYDQLGQEVEKIFYEFQQDQQRKTITQEKQEEYLKFLLMTHDRINQEQKKVDTIELKEIKKKGIKKTKQKASR